MGETSICNPKGSVFMMDLDDQIIKPICLNCLAYPSGLALDKNNELLFVCETMKNRVLRFYIGDEGNHLSSVFYQFSGRLGPTAIDINKENQIFVAHFEFAHFSKEGIIHVLSPKGKLLQTISIPEYPQINGLAFSKSNDNILLVTEYSNTPVCLRVLVQNSEHEKNEDKNEDYNKFN